MTSNPVRVRKLEPSIPLPFWVDKKGDGAEEDELVSNDEVNRLVKLLEEDPNKLNEAEQDQLCRSVDVDTIMSLAFKWGKEMGMDDFATVRDKRVRKCPKPDQEEMGRTTERMVRNPEKVKETQMSHLYTSTFYEFVLEIALPSWKVKEGVSGFNREELLFLSRFLPFKLFAHVFYEKTGVRLFGSDEETGSDDEELKALGEDSTSFVRKREGEAVCPICEKIHPGLCPYMEDVPVGAKIGRDYDLMCQGCGLVHGKENCPGCGFVGRCAVLKFCSVCREDGECLKDDDKHRLARAREAEAAKSIVWDDEQYRQYSPKWCSMCCDNDHSAENCGMKESSKEDTDECERSK